MERFQKLLEDPHKYAKEWKAKTGGKVLGYFCHYFPEELVYAAGVLPVRVLSQPDNEGISQRYLYGHFCPTSLGILAQGLKGNYDYLNGIGHAECCMSVRGAYASWRLHVPPEYEHFVAVPSHVDTPRASKLLRAEISAFKRELEGWTGKVITEEALNHAIEVYNTSRSLMRQVYELRRLDNPPVTGAEAFEMILTSQIMDKEEHNKLLKDAISKLPGREVKNIGPRLMLIGSEISDTKLVRFIESIGATIVIDGLCNGSSYIWTNIVPQEDLLLAIAQRYLDKEPRCPMKDIRYRRRPTQLMGLAMDYNVKGVVYAIERFCHPHQFDRPPIEKALKERYIAFHNLEYDGTIPTIEFQTRLEAFIDTLRRPLVAL